MSASEFKNVLYWLHVNSGKTIQRTLSKKNSCEQNWNVHHHWHGRRMPTDDNRSESVDYGKTGGYIKSSLSVRMHLRQSYWNTLVHRGMSSHQLFVLLCHSQQAIPALPQQLHPNVVFQGQDMHAFFIHHEQARNVCKSFKRYQSSWLKKVPVGIERNRAIPTKWQTGSGRRCVGGSRHMVDWIIGVFLMVLKNSILSFLGPRLPYSNTLLSCSAYFVPISLLPFFSLKNENVNSVAWSHLVLFCTDSVCLWSPCAEQVQGGEGAQASSEQVSWVVH